jgi:predicted RNA-binding protein associated with RNAse of E/G family
MTLAPGGEVTVRLLKFPGEKIRYAATVLNDDGNHLAVRAPFAGGRIRDMGFVKFEPGDVWTEHYWRDRWFSVKEIVTAEGVRKGWYCDVTRPVTVDDSMITAVDLDLDLWRSGDGREILRLDEDEFAASGLAERDPEAAAQAERSLDVLETIARGGFDELLAF